MKQFASGRQGHYYGKGDVSVYRINRGDATAGAVFGARVLMLVYGEAFWPTYTSGDNRAVIATDSMRNFIERETMAFLDADLESYCRHLGRRFLDVYPAVEGVQVSAVEAPYAAVGRGHALAPAGHDRATARVELGRGRLIEAVSGLQGFTLLTLGGSSFRGFVRDQYTTLADAADRPLQISLDLEWQYLSPEDAFNDGCVVTRARQIVHDVFASFESRSIQHLLHQIGTTLLQDLPTLAEVSLEAGNRTWKTVAAAAEDVAGDPTRDTTDDTRVSVYADAHGPYGCLGLRLRR